MLSGSNEKFNDELNKNMENASLLAQDLSSQIFNSVQGLLSNILSSPSPLSNISHTAQTQLDVQKLIPSIETTEKYVHVKLNGQVISQINLDEIKEQATQIYKNAEK